MIFSSVPMALLFDFWFKIILPLSFWIPVIEDLWQLTLLNSVVDIAKNTIIIACTPQRFPV